MKKNHEPADRREIRVIFRLARVSSSTVKKSGGFFTIRFLRSALDKTKGL
jgi:hypothetical protein